MSLHIINENSPAPGGYWRYRQPESGQEFQSPYYDQLKAAVKKHRVAMNYPIGANFDEEMERAMCERHPNACSEQNPFSPPNIVDQAVSFFSSMAVWSREGFKILSREKYLERRAICAGDKHQERCRYWGGDRGLGFGRCGKCGCNGLKLFVETEKCPINKW